MYATIKQLWLVLCPSSDVDKKTHCADTSGPHTHKQHTHTVNAFIYWWYSFGKQWLFCLHSIVQDKEKQKTQISQTQWWRPPIDMSLLPKPGKRRNSYARGGTCMCSPSTTAKGQSQTYEMQPADGLMQAIIDGSGQAQEQQRTTTREKHRVVLPSSDCLR